MTLVAYVPDLMDRSRLTAAGVEVLFVARPDDLLGTDAGIVVVDLGRPGVLEVLPELRGKRVIGFGSHVDRELLAAAATAGCDEVMTRSAFFSQLSQLLG